MLWPPARLGEAMELLARKAKILLRPHEAPIPPQAVVRGERARLERWVDLAADQLGIEAESVSTSYSEVATFIRGAGPAVIEILHRPTQEGTAFVAISGARWDWVALLSPDFKTRWVRAREVERLLCTGYEAPFASSLQPYLDSLPSASAANEAARQGLVRESVIREGHGSGVVGRGWLLRPIPGASLYQHARHERLFRPLIWVILTFLTAQVLLMASWAIIGQGTLQGQFEMAWVWAWVLTTLTTVLMEIASIANQNEFLLGGGGLFKRHLLYGTLQLKPDEIRHQGAGQFLGRVMESESLESLAMTGGLSALVGIVMLLVDGVVLALGAGGWLHTLLLFGWFALTLFMGWRYYRTGTVWLNSYRAMTNDLVERMVGHRTRLAQENPKRWHTEEDQGLAHYLKLSERLDRIEAQLGSLIPRGWLLVGLAGLAPALLNGTGSLATLTISVGGILFAFQAFSNLTGTLKGIIGALMAWSQVEPLLDAAARRKESGTLVLAEAPSEEARQAPLVVARDLLFRYRPHRPPVLHECNLEVLYGDRMLLEGPSGSGKSTLGNLLAGLNQAESGLLLLRGFDHRTVGSDIWRQRILVVPQFQENHIFTASLAFNLFMGRQWPPTTEELAEAEAICRELGLGRLLDQMPERFDQLVGESGWHLSHGEKSRIYIARALLQKADLLILDESFGALDPENLRGALECVLRRTPTLLVIAHP